MLIIEQIADGDTEHDALLWVAGHLKKIDDQLTQDPSASSSVIKEMLMLRDVNGVSGVSGAAATFNLSFPRKYVDELRTVIAIMRLRAAIIVLRKDVNGRDAPMKAITGKAGGNYQRNLELLRWLADRGEYTGFSHRRHRTQE